MKEHQQSSRRQTPMIGVYLLLDFSFECQVKSSNYLV